MRTLETAPGVLGAALTTYVTPEDVKKLLGCHNSKAYQVIKEVNRKAKDLGGLSYGAGKANKYLFAEKFRIPIEVVNSIIDVNKE